MFRLKQGQLDTRLRKILLQIYYISNRLLVYFTTIEYIHLNDFFCPLVAAPPEPKESVFKGLSRAEKQPKTTQHSIIK